jgi:hypothetical protein
MRFKTASAPSNERQHHSAKAQNHVLQAQRSRHPVQNVDPRMQLAVCPAGNFQNLFLFKFVVIKISIYKN